MTVLALSLARLGWRVTHRAPALPDTMSGFERFAAHATHAFFYAMMIGMPLTGSALVSVSPFNIPTLLWRTIPCLIAALRDLAGPAKEVAGSLSTARMWRWPGGAALIGLHVRRAQASMYQSRWCFGADGAVPLSATPR
jgi:cytochrome b561